MVFNKAFLYYIFNRVHKEWVGGLAVSYHVSVVILS